MFKVCIGEVAINDVIGLLTEEHYYYTYLLLCVFNQSDTNCQ